ncbi:SDR family NAD(P)-dependent oxidoreductase [Glaciihabitans sp. dw_435]|uniref:SDR family NAD(P)-dependent oxidoreductase n=1 Tax=Glaciihabitans sp. dw_435 TaxID=2720081 RepID=UPI001BD5E1C5|nr:glucose 1-dehydrogenase [Glaciihabitans sp. dw_435]
MTFIEPSYPSITGTAPINAGCTPASSQLRGKVAVITGGSSGIGLATARRFIEEGARVFITGRRQAELDAAVELLGDQASGIRGDVSKLDDLDRVFAEVGSEAGRVDVVFANAGGGTGIVTIDDITVDMYEKVFGANVAGTLFTVQKALPLMSSGGSIIITGSTSASRGHPGFGIYSASKAAVRQLTRVCAAELAPRGIRVNTVTPGPTDTPGIRGIARGDREQEQALLASMAAKIPLGRVGDPAEIANAVLFLASEQASFMTGAEIFVDGGDAQVLS